MADQTALYVTVLQNEVESLRAALREAEAQRDEWTAKFKDWKPEAVMLAWETQRNRAEAAEQEIEEHRQHAQDKHRRAEALERYVERNASGQDWWDNREQYGCRAEAGEPPTGSWTERRCGTCGFRATIPTCGHHNWFEVTSSVAEPEREGAER